MIRVILLSGVTAGETRGYCDLTPKEVSGRRATRRRWAFREAPRFPTPPVRGASCSVPLRRESLKPTPHFPADAGIAGGLRPSVWRSGKPRSNK